MQSIRKLTAAIPVHVTTAPAAPGALGLLQRRKLLGDSDKQRRGRPKKSKQLRIKLIVPRASSVHRRNQAEAAKEPQEECTITP